MGFPAHGHLCATCNGVGDMCTHLIQGGRLDQRSNLDPHLGARPNPKLGDFFGKFFGESIIDAILNINTICTDTGLPGIAILGSNRSLNRSIDIGIVKHNKRRVTAEL